MTRSINSTRQSTSSVGRHGRKCGLGPKCGPHSLQRRTQGVTHRRCHPLAGHPAAAARCPDRHLSFSSHPGQSAKRAGDWGQSELDARIARVVPPAERHHRPVAHGRSTGPGPTVSSRSTDHSWTDDAEPEHRLRRHDAAEHTPPCGVIPDRPATHRSRWPVLARRTPARCAACCATARSRSAGCCATPKWDDVGPRRRCRSSRSSRTPTNRETATSTSPSIPHRKSCDSKPNTRSRSVVPSDPALAFIDMLIEDFGDEWVTKMMYHYRWAYDTRHRQSRQAAPTRPRTCNSTPTRHRRDTDFITHRQISRRALVGSTDWNTPLIEDSYRRGARHHARTVLTRRLPARRPSRPRRFRHLSASSRNSSQLDPTSMADRRRSTARRRSIRWVERHGRPLLAAGRWRR